MEDAELEFAAGLSHGKMGIEGLLPAREVHDVMTNEDVDHEIAPDIRVHVAARQAELLRQNDHNAPGF